MQELEIKLHPIASVFPPMTDDEFAKLKADIAEHGQRESIVYWNQMLIDGRHRLRACQELGIEPIEVELDADHDPIAFALSHNLHRRHLTTSQRAMVASKLANLKHGSNQHKKEGGQNCTSSISDSAKALNVSPRSVKNAKKVQDKGSEELNQAVERGEVTVSKAAAIVTEEPNKDKQKEKLEASKAKTKEPRKKKQEPFEYQDVEDDEPQEDCELEEFKKFWNRCSDISKTAIRVWIEDQPT